VKLAVLCGPRTFDVVDADVPAIAPDEVLVRVANCGVCASELDMWEGKVEAFPRFPGHEVSGVVEAVGDEVETLHPGDAVAVWVTERGFAEYVAVKADYCLRADGVPLDLALAEPVACAVNTVELASPSLGDDVVVFGAGFMGNLVQKLTLLRGPRRLIVVDPREDALARATELGATHVLRPGTDDVVAGVRELTEGKGADLTYEVTGVQGPLDVAGDVTRMSGKIAIVGFHQGGTRAIPLGHWNWMAFTIVNAHFREVETIMRGMRIGMRLLSSGRLSLEGLVSHRFPLGGIGEAFATAHSKPHGFVKATVELGS
jgi:2-desacetyl-2-hydroxyethyl bacteriochlorophyllide A dehydrogenase